MKRELKYVWWKRNYFPHIILERPREINEMSKSNGITRADDLFFVKDKYVYWGKMDIYRFRFSCFYIFRGFFKRCL